MFLPTTRQEMDALGWEAPDVILITGDTYIDSPYMGVAVIGKYLLTHGFTVAIIAQPITDSGKDITRLGLPRLFWGVTAGAVDSMVANTTATGKYRRQDDYTPGGINVRPNRASIVYTNLIRRWCRPIRPIVLGGIEASLRRFAHYDHTDRRVRRSLLFDTKADVLAYGMAEKSVAALATAFRDGTDWRRIAGTCVIGHDVPDGYEKLPDYETVATDTAAFMAASRQMARLGDDTTCGCAQRHGDRFVIHHPASSPMIPAELDAVYEMDFEHDVHPFYRTGKVRALDTIRQSITSHRGCFGQCRFCAITVHQGSRIVSRSPESILREATRMARKPGFNGIIYDVGGPTANMYGVTCRRNWVCRDRHCLMPRICPNLVFGHRVQVDVLKRLMAIPGIRSVFIASGIRHDMVMADGADSVRYVEQLVRHHVSGQLKLAPEHSEPDVLNIMNKPPVDSLLAFKALFERTCARMKTRYFLTYYLMVAHPGCTPQHMRELNRFLVNRLHVTPEQIQVFTPTPGTLSTAMYHAGTDLDGRTIFCERSPEGKDRQKRMIRQPGSSGKRRMGR
ncbi:YgiQ family radical SAM protein [bacterium]|nr:YgiQ family radical SAM protein [candidate division CSSED10-310 bacterium]